MLHHIRSRQMISIKIIQVLFQDPDYRLQYSEITLELGMFAPQLLPISSDQVLVPAGLKLSIFGHSGFVMDRRPPDEEPKGERQCTDEGGKNAVKCFWRVKGGL